MSEQGWHMHGGGVHTDNATWCARTNRTPVLVVPVAGAREAIARALSTWDGGQIPWDDPTWTGDRKRKHYRLRADAVLAALAAVPPEGEEADERDPAVMAAWRGENPDVHFESEPCARQHTPGRVCILPDGHDLAPTPEGGRDDG